MKKINYVFIMLIALMIAPRMVFAIAGGEQYNLNANTSRNVAENAVVSGVEKPVYDVTIAWEGLEFDWRYDEEEKQYGWKDRTFCEPRVINNVNSVTLGTNETLYSDSDCFHEVDALETTGTYYVGTPGYTNIMIWDNSEGGYIEPSISWASASNYSFTTANIGYDYLTCTLVDEETFNDIKNDIYLFTSSDCTGTPLDFSQAPFDTYYAFTSSSYVYGGGATINNMTIPLNARVYSMGGSHGAWVSGDGPKNMYSLDFSLGVDRTKTVRTPVVGETIGTLTVKITTK